MRIVFRQGESHVVSDAETTALCGADVGGWPGVSLEPGADFGVREHDCRKCLRALRNMAREARP